MEVLPLDQLEGIEVSRGREAGLRPGDVEADDALVAVPHRKLGGLDRAGRLAHRGDEQLQRDPPPLLARLMLALAEPVEDRRHHLVEREAALGGELGRVPHFGVDHTVGREVLGALGRNTLDRIACLEKGDGVAESLEVELEALTVGAAEEPARELGRVARRQLALADVGSELQHGFRAQAAVEVVVQQRLRRPADRFDLQQRPLRRFSHGILRTRTPDLCAIPDDSR